MLPSLACNLNRAIRVNIRNRLPMKIPWSLCLVLFASAALAQTPDVGSGSPTETIRNSFINSYFRNGFPNLVSLPPLADVKKLGTQGLVQEFPDASKSSANKYALVMTNTAIPVSADFPAVVQMYPPLYSYYTSVGPTAAGYPKTDTLNCPTVLSAPGDSCQYQLFDKPYALFVYKSSVPLGGTNFATRDPYYTKWQSLGGISSVGPAIGAEQSITSSAGATATVQIFDQGMVVNTTSGLLSGRLVGIGQTVYSLYAASRTYAGVRGLPTADEITLPSGRHRQTFEGGAIEYDPGGPPVLRFSVHDVQIAAAATKITLNLGGSLTLQVLLFDPNGNPLTDRTVIWSTSNSRVLSVQASGLAATIKAVGGGSATVTAISEGKSSAPLSIFVSAPCCGVGEGAPTS